MHSDVSQEIARISAENNEGWRRSEEAKELFWNRVAFSRAFIKMAYEYGLASEDLEALTAEKLNEFICHFFEESEKNIKRIGWIDRAKAKRHIPHLTNLWCPLYTTWNGDWKPTCRNLKLIHHSFAYNFLYKKLADGGHNELLPFGSWQHALETTLHPRPDWC